ncbi:MAG: hypothetical protein II921_04645 [Treponema sp.]|nr:hypothetical protein [Treponema sp.]
MKKTLLLITAVFLLANANLFAYDFRQVVFGNHYEQIREITDESAIEKLRAEFEPLREHYSKENGYYTSGGDNLLNLRFYKLYKESYANGTIYRMLCYEYDSSFDFFVDGFVKDKYKKRDYNYDYLDGAYQFVLLKDESGVNCLGVYQIYYYDIGGGYDANGESKIFKNFSVIARDSEIKAFLLTKTTDSYVDLFREKKVEVTKKSEGFWLYFNDRYMSWLPMDFEKDGRAIRIDASFPLIDKDRPFMYTLQNAFDGDEKTSFVEDTADDLLRLEITSGKEQFSVRQIRIINGYAASKKLYKSNNRIRQIASDYCDHLICKDDMLTYQRTEWYSLDLTVESVYKGEKYSDTCLAEIDFLLDFGEEEAWFASGYKYTPQDGAQPQQDEVKCEFPILKPWNGIPKETQAPMPAEESEVSSPAIEYYEVKRPTGSH